MSSSVAVAGPARSGIGMRFISRSTTLKVKQSKIVPGAVCKLRDSRASSGRAASPNNNNKPAALSSFDNTVTEESARTSEDSGLLSYLISCAVGAGQFSLATLAVTFVGSVVKDFFTISHMMANWDWPEMAKATVILFLLSFFFNVLDPLPPRSSRLK